MKTKLYLLIVNFYSIVQNQIINADNQEQVLKELEDNKQQMYQEISAAIDSSIDALNKTNDADAHEGIRYMQELKKYLAEFNATELGIARNRTGLSNVTHNTTQLNILESIFGNNTNSTGANALQRFRKKYMDENDKIRAILIDLSVKEVQEKKRKLFNSTKATLPRPSTRRKKDLSDILHY